MQRTSLAYNVLCLLGILAAAIFIHFNSFALTPPPVTGTGPLPAPGVGTGMFVPPPGALPGSGGPSGRRGPSGAGGGGVIASSDGGGAGGSPPAGPANGARTRKPTH